MWLRQLLLVTILAFPSLVFARNKNGVDFIGNLNLNKENTEFNPNISANVFVPSPSDSFAACLLTMDDKHRLIEWLAYHYHTLPLRRLIVMEDPNSRTSPSSVLDRWIKYIKIDLWSDGDIFSEEELKERVNEYGDNDIKIHRSRQRAFNKQCMQTLRKEGHSWTLMTDVDEYLYINPRVWDPSDPLFQEFIEPIQIEEPGSVLKMLDKIDLDDDRFHAQEWKACIPVARLQFGGMESSPKQVQNKFPKFFEPSLLAQDFDTFRWRYHGIDDITAHDGIIPGKTIVNLANVPEEELRRFIGDPHRPIQKLCSGSNVWLNTTETLFLANHVLGTMEQFAARDDSRFVDRVLTWEKRRNIGGYLSDEIRSWLSGFIKEVGKDESRRLLANVGQVQTKTFELPPCSLNFFGLPRSFKKMALPSIVKNILITNADYNCDVFVHYYKIDHDDEGRFNHGGKIDTESIHALKLATEVIASNAGKRPPSITIIGETKEEFDAKHGDLVNHYKTAKDPKTEKLKYFPWADASYKSTKQVENIVMQWNSIQSAWNEMENHADTCGIEYERIAFFRLDAFYALPVDIFQVDKDTYDYTNRYAVIPGFAKHPVNDRMIYGPAKAIKIWATERIERLEHHIATYEPKGYGMHSERYLAHEIIPAIMDETGYEVVENNDICFYRTRASDSVIISDCQDAKGGTTRGIHNINQIQLVEDLIKCDCIEIPLDETGRFMELRCDETLQAGITKVSTRFLQSSEPPTPTVSPISSTSFPSSSPVVFESGVEVEVVAEIKQKMEMEGVKGDACPADVKDQYSESLRQALDGSSDGDTAVNDINCIPVDEKLKSFAFDGLGVDFSVFLTLRCDGQDCSAALESVSEAADNVVNQITNSISDGTFTKSVVEIAAELGVVGLANVTVDISTFSFEEPVVQIVASEDSEPSEQDFFSRVLKQILEFLKVIFDFLTEFIQD